jgi:putative addiction module component (TIGR02574 family)
MGAGGVMSVSLPARSASHYSYNKRTSPDGSGDRYLSKGVRRQTTTLLLSLANLSFPQKIGYSIRMAPSTQQLLKDALKLPDEQRAELVVELLDSLPPAEPTQARSNTEWLAEIERRARAAQAGAPSRSWQDARKQVLDRLPKL